ncbi:MAG: hypothetical protein JW993_11330 [Sedimentisphaerales bacterium]|nr:hypothetical protein [Sedimentisphaerales bacterium]
MQRHAASVLWIAPILSLPSLLVSPAWGYDNFQVSIYCRAYETRQMGDPSWIESRWDEIARQVHVDKVYLETYRDQGNLVDAETLAKAKQFFADRGVRTAGGITLTVSERNRFETFCYTNPEHRRTVREIVEFTARNFDEVILDDFYFTNCKCELCIEAKGNKSWTEYRTALLTEAARNVIAGPARAVNPNVKLVIKYPNWYEHFQGLGFNLETEPKIFDRLYTGTETRDPSSNQHLQQYLGYLIFRYFENLKPGCNGGGWVDTGGMMYTDRYAEQLWLTLFAKAPEITLFDLRQVQRGLRGPDNTPWQDQQTSFNYQEMMKPIQLADGATVQPTMIARAAGYTFEKVDQFLGQLGKPVGVKSYKPYHSTGEDFLQTYLGMCGIPMDIVPEFPTEESMVLLTEQTKFDPQIVGKIKRQLLAGKSVCITSGLLRALQGKGIEDIAELRYTDRKATVKEFRAGFGGRAQIQEEMTIPQIVYLTNDAWEEISAMDGTNGWPMLISAGYAKGTLYVLTIPENFADLYHLPVSVLSRIKDTLVSGLPVRLDGPGLTSLFVYDNDTFIVESFLDEPVDVTVVVGRQISGIRDLQSDEVISPGGGGGRFGGRRGGFGAMGGSPRTTFALQIEPHSYRVFKCE